jgi:hypothetical protein
MMIVLFTMGYGHHRIYTTSGTQKRAGAFTLALFMPLYFGRVSPRYACAAEAWADHDGPPFRLFPDGGRSTCGGRIKVLAWSASSCVQELSVQGSVWRGTSPPLGGPGPYGQPVHVSDTLRLSAGRRSRPAGTPDKGPCAYSTIRPRFRSPTLPICPPEVIRQDTPRGTRSLRQCRKILPFSIPFFDACAPRCQGAPMRLV